VPIKKKTQKLVPKSVRYKEEKKGSFKKNSTVHEKGFGQKANRKSRFRKRVNAMGEKEGGRGGGTVIWNGETKKRYTND